MQVKSKTSCDLARLARDIENVVSRCSVCSKFQVENRKEPLKSHEIPDRPWQKVGVDVFELFGRDCLCTLYRDYLCIVDYYCKFPEICMMKNKTAECIITHMKSVFSRHGIPDEVMSDNMPFSGHKF